MNARARISLSLPCLLAGPAFAQTKGQLRLPEFAALADKASEIGDVTLDAQSARPGLPLPRTPTIPNRPRRRSSAPRSPASTCATTPSTPTYAYPKARHRRRAPPVDCARAGAASSKRAARRNTPMSTSSCSSTAARRRASPIIASEPREFTIVNIVGSIDLEQLHELEGKFGVPELEIETGKKPAPAPAPAPTKPKNQIDRRTDAPKTQATSTVSHRRSFHERSARGSHDRSPAR